MPCEETNVDITGNLDAIEQAIKSCDAEHWPNMLRWQIELQQNTSRTIVENLVLCYIELEARKRGDRHDEAQGT